MSIQPVPVPPVPDETARIARAAFPKGNLYIKMRDEFGSIYHDAPFVPLFPARGQPGYAPWRLALVTILQFVEGLSDRQAADAVRARLDWKYLLSLDVADPGFDASILSEFRTRLVAGHAEEDLFIFMLERFRSKGWVKGGGTQRTDSTHVLAAVRGMTRMEIVSETLRYALNSLAGAAPAWLRTSVPREWVKCYTHRADDYRFPLKDAARETRLVRIGADGYTLLTAIYAAEAPPWLREMAAVTILRQVWLQQFTREEGAIQWRANDNIPPCALGISSPYDVDAHYSKKETTTWVGYKVHLTETCDTDAPHLITHVETALSCTPDGNSTDAIHAGLQADGLLPKTHIVDSGYVDAQLLVTSAETYAVDLYGPTRADYHWQAKSGGGFAAAHFRIDWPAHVVTCPEGKQSVSWTPAVDDRTNAVIKIKFSQKDCQICPSRALCTTGTRRTITVRKEDHHAALQKARLREETPEFAHTYAQRAGIEGTLSQSIRRCDIRHNRYRGMAKTHLQHILIGAALNFVRAGAWLLEKPQAKTRTSAFQAVMCAAA